MTYKSELRYEELNGEIVVLEADRGVVHRISGETAEAVRAESNGMTRRTMIRAAIAMGAAAGVTTLALPTAAAAASGVGGSGGVGGGGGGTSLAAPTGVTGEEGNSSAKISWDSVTGATGYKVYFGNGTVAWTGSTTSTTITSLSNGTPYSFYVTATKTGEESAASLTVSVTPSSATRPDFPVDLTASQFRDAEYDYRNVVTWTSRSAADDGTWEFELQYKKASAATWTSTVTVNGDRAAQILGLEPGTTYSFRVRERYLGVWSFWSITATLTTAAFEFPSPTRVAADFEMSNPALVYYGIFNTPGGYATATFQGRYSANGGTTWSNWVDLVGDGGEYPMAVSGGLPDTLTYQLRAKWNGFFSPAWTIEYMNFNDFWNW